MNDLISPQAVRELESLGILDNKLKSAEALKRLPVLIRSRINALRATMNSKDRADDISQAWVLDFENEDAVSLFVWLHWRGDGPRLYGPNTGAGRAVLLGGSGV